MLYTPMPLGRVAEPFNDRDWLFELRYDGFRSVAHFSDGQCRLVSRNGNVFRTFLPLADSLAQVVCTNDTVLDGEVVCIDGQGRPQFYDLLFRRGEPLFFASDMLRLNVTDVAFYVQMQLKDYPKPMLDSFVEAVRKRANSSE